MSRVLDYHISCRLTSVSSNIYLKQKKAGGMKITFQNPPKNIDEKMVYNILRDYKMLNCEVLVRDEYGTANRPILVFTLLTFRQPR